VTNSIIQRNVSDDIIQSTDNPYDNVLYYENSELQEDNQKLRTATAQLQEELAKVKEELTQIYNSLHNEESTKSTSRASIPGVMTAHPHQTASPNEIQDLLSSTHLSPKPKDLKSLSQQPEDNVLQAKLAKELIKLATSYKIQELTFDIQALKRRFNFSTWFSKMQTILSMFP
jgi:DNA repair exonuclease SbcCD ATPase subunit